MKVVEVEIMRERFDDPRKEDWSAALTGAEVAKRMSSTYG